MFRRRDAQSAAETGKKGTQSAAGADDAVAAEELDEEVDEELDDELAADSTEDQPEDMTADLESQAADYLAGNDVWMYGPNAEAVLLILDRLEEIGPDDARPLAEAWLAVPKSDRDRARKAAQKAGRRRRGNRPLPAARQGKPSPRGRPSPVHTPNTSPPNRTGAASAPNAPKPRSTQPRP